MKLILLEILLLTNISCSFPSQMPKGKNIEITIKLDSITSSHEQWVYIHHYVGNEHLIEDSAYIKKGQKKVILYAHTPQEEHFIILFSKKGPINMYLPFAPNEHIEIDILKTSGFHAETKIKGSPSANEKKNKIEHEVILNAKKRDLHAQLSMPELSDKEIKSISEQIKKVNMQIDSIEMNTIIKSFSPRNVEGSLRYFKEKVSRDSLISLYNLATRRFPDDKSIKRILHPVQVPPETEESKRIDEHISHIIQTRIKEEVKFKQENKNVKHRKITEISLLSDKGEKVAISKLKGKYILIDFWASWCIPCLEELPYVRQAKKAFGNQLTVCTISMDKNHDVWIKAISDYNLNDLINLSVMDKKGNMDEKAEGLNIKTIPYNFLLDENHKVIATNLHKKDLLEKLDQLIK